MPASKLASPRKPLHLIREALVHTLPLLPLVLLTLGVGMWIYHGVEGLPWPDAFLNAAMLLGGMGPVDRLQTTEGKWLAGTYALFAGLVFLAVASAMLSPMVRTVLHRFHLEREQEP